MAADTTQSNPRSLVREDYTIGWISTLAVESAAANAMLTEKHQRLSTAEGDTNSYVLGSIGGHNIAMACINEAGGLPAHIVASHLMTSFPNVRYVLMVGLGGGIPSDRYDIRLGDIVVSEPMEGSPGVVQSDFGKWESEGFKRTGSLNRPAEGLVRVMGAMKRLDILGESRIHSYVKHLPTGRFRHPNQWAFQGINNDPMYENDQTPRKVGICPECELLTEYHSPDPIVHYGIIASGNHVVKNEHQRTELLNALGVCCVEMEAFGLMNNFPCLVIRGISDYADGRKNDKWQSYAALTAAAYAKELLLELPAVDVFSTPPVSDQLLKRQYARAKSHVGSF
ncbi:uncharacterized protein N7482_000334 [Penicillium canariense]|uniref:Nucleoside phosphorylase domain-containing protein n=1 Tax=Penicillium canariense TaxID=189055 RepID=A0A9W9IDL6_9EURO|nr:uncharacterized protein N7482_000334 [Penicillium canariense]KAJ5174457.1 hypothetical protein N7482_000334 [Penicillium canariense]